MLAIGDKVVYPMHGAGVIEAIEEHEVLGERQLYYILTMPFGGMKVMIPMQSVDNIGLRDIIAEPEVQRVIDILQTAPVPVNVSWNRRFNACLVKLKTGSIYEVAEVVKNLMSRDQVKKLSTGERRLLDTAKQILVSELVLVCRRDPGSVEEWVHDLCQENTPGN